VLCKPHFLVCNPSYLNSIQVTDGPSGIQNLGYKFWIIWAVICFAFIPITYFLYPETANRTLEDIDRFFETKPGVFIHHNKLAVQLHRPAEFIEADARIAANEEEKMSPELVETKETV
jgi:hypothetical protein